MRAEALQTVSVCFGRIPRCPSVLTSVACFCQEDCADAGDESGDWSERLDPSTQRAYWHNARTQESTWVKPSC